MNEDAGRRRLRRVEHKHIKIVFSTHQNTRHKFVHVKLLTSQSKPYLIWFSLVNTRVDMCATTVVRVVAVEIRQQFSIVDDIHFDLMMKIAWKVLFHVGHSATVAWHNRRSSSQR